MCVASVTRSRRPVRGRGLKPDGSCRLARLESDSNNSDDTCLRDLMGSASRELVSGNPGVFPRSRDDAARLMFVSAGDGYGSEMCRADQRSCESHALFSRSAMAI